MAQLTLRDQLIDAFTDDGMTDWGAERSADVALQVLTNHRQLCRPRVGWLRVTEQTHGDSYFAESNEIDTEGCSLLSTLRPGTYIVVNLVELKVESDPMGSGAKVGIFRLPD